MIFPNINKEDFIKMRIKSNSLLAVLMAVMLILGLTPSTAFAADQKATPGTVTLTGISAPTYNKINIRWNRTSNATHYKIYYKKPVQANGQDLPL